MFRFIASTLTVGMLCTAALAEDRATGQSEASQQSPQQQQTTGQTSGTAGAAADPAQADQAQPAGAREGQQDPAKMFVKEAMEHNNFEIKAAEMAQQRIQDPEVKKFAQMLMEDHRKANEKLMTMAQAMGIQTSQEGKLDAVHQAKLQKMQECPASEFDRKYINGQVAGHTMDVLEYAYQSGHAKNDQVKQYASTTLPKLQQHLQKATQLAAAQGGGEAQPASGRLPAERPSDSTTGQDQAAPGATDPNRSGTGADKSASPSSGAGATDPSGASGTDTAK